MDDSLQILVGDCYERLSEIEARSVQCCVTSPPYWGLRDYGIPGTAWPAMTYAPMPGLPSVGIAAWEGCLGLEADPLAFIGHLLLIFREVRRTLADDGTVWVNLGDSYSTKPTGTTGYQDGRANRESRLSAGIYDQVGDKNLLGIPWRFALAMQADGWTLRSEIIWNKPNPMPESVQDQPTKAHEQLFLFSKGPRYFYDKVAAREAVSGTANPRGGGVNPKSQKSPDGWDTSKGGGGHGTIHKAGREKGRTRPKQNASFSAAVAGLVDDRNWRDVWTIPSEPYREAHFATFPTALPRRCILAGSRPGDLILDPFGGSGTTAAVAIEEGRRAVLCEAKPEYANLAETRCCGVMTGLGI